LFGHFCGKQVRYGAPLEIRIDDYGESPQEAPAVGVKSDDFRAMA
jgi:hypothetical protein